MYFDFLPFSLDIEQLSQIAENTDTNNILEFSLNALKQKDSMTIKFLIVIAIIYFCMLLLTSLIIPLIINKNTRKNEVLKIKTERKLDYIENLLIKIRIINSSLSILDDDNIKKTQNNIKILRKQIYCYTFKIPQKMSVLIIEFLDYCDKVLLNSYTRDTTKEQELYDKICKEYESIK